MNNNMQSWQITESHEIKRIIERERNPENIFNMICIENDLYITSWCHHFEWYWYMYDSVDQSLSPGGATMGLTNTRPWILAAFIGMASLKSPFSCLLAVTALPSLGVLIILLPSLRHWQKIKFPYTPMARTHVRQSQSARLTGKDFVQKVSAMRLSIIK